MDEKKNAEILSWSPSELLLHSKKYHQERVRFHQEQIDLINKMMKQSPVGKYGQLKLVDVKSPMKNQGEGRIKWTKNILQVLNDADAPLKTSRIVDLMYPAVDEATRRRYISYVSGTLIGMIKRKKAKKKETKGEKGDYYGLPDWFEGNELKDEYLKKIGM